MAGASGFVGERILEDLVRTGHTVTAHVHSDSSRRAIEAKFSGLFVVQANLANSSEVHGIIPNGTEAVIYTPGVLRESKSLTFEAIHVDGVRNMLREAQRASVQRWIELSALGVAANATTKYYETKWRAEEMLKASGIDWTSIRPSLIFDDRPRRQHNFVVEIAKAIRMAPFVPILGTGKYLLQPVSVDDVSQTIVQSLTKPQTIGENYDLGGPQKMTYFEVVSMIAEAIGTRKPRVKIPLSIIMIAARLLDWLPVFPITVDEIRMLTAGNYIREEAREREWRTTFELPMKPFSTAACRAMLQSVS